MRMKSGTPKPSADRVVRDIRRKTCKRHSTEEKIRIVLSGLRGEDSIAELCRREGISQSLYYSWSKEFLEAGRRRLAGDTARQATSPEVKNLRAESAALKEACGSSHHWAREISKLGHEVRLMPAFYVKPYVKRGKTDGFTIDLHGELGAILALVDGKQKLPDAERAGSSLSVVAGARNQRCLPGPRCMLPLPDGHCRARRAR